MVNSNFPDVQMLVSSFSHLSPSIEPVVGVEPSVGGSVVLMTEAEVPLANAMSHISNVIYIIQGDPKKMLHFMPSFVG